MSVVRVTKLQRSHGARKDRVDCVIDVRRRTRTPDVEKLHVIAGTRCSSGRRGSSVGPIAASRPIRIRASRSSPVRLIATSPPSARAHARGNRPRICCTEMQNQDERTVDTSSGLHDTPSSHRKAIGWGNSRILGHLSPPPAAMLDTRRGTRP